jgi:hypothetical protein
MPVGGFVFQLAFARRIMFGRSEVKGIKAICFKFIKTGFEEDPVFIFVRNLATPVN